MFQCFTQKPIFLHETLKKNWERLRTRLYSLSPSVMPIGGKVLKKKLGEAGDEATFLANHYITGHKYHMRGLPTRLVAPIAVFTAGMF